jgi:hypothetical protein
MIGKALATLVALVILWASVSYLRDQLSGRDPKGR